MNSIQNRKITQVKETTMIVGMPEYISAPEAAKFSGLWLIYTHDCRHLPLAKYNEWARRKRGTWNWKMNAPTSIKRCRETSRGPYESRKEKA